MVGVPIVIPVAPIETIDKTLLNVILAEAEK